MSQYLHVEEPDSATLNYKRTFNPSANGKHPKRSSCYMRKL